MRLRRFQCAADDAAGYDGDGQRCRTGTEEIPMACGLRGKVRLIALSARATGVQNLRVHGRQGETQRQFSGP